MKPTLILSTLALTCGTVFASSYRPIGSLDVNNTYVRTGHRPLVSWNITYPADLQELIIPDPGGRVTTLQEVRVKMRVAGVAFQSGSTQLPVAFSTKVGSGAWQELFYGTGDQVQAGEFVYDQVVPAGTTLDFGGQARRSNGEWYDSRWTSGTDETVTGLFNGDTPPSYAPAYQQGDVESFLSSYLSPENTIQIGPHDMIYLFELASRDPGEWWFDMQDLVVVVTYEEVSASGPTPPGHFISQNNRGRRALGNPLPGWRDFRDLEGETGPGAWRPTSGDGEVCD